MAVLLLIFLPSALHGPPYVPGILNQKAPLWEVSEWVQLPEGRKSLELSDLNGKVIYLYCFQAWCPGCHKYGFPTLQQVQSEFAGDDDVAIVAVQTTFEGFSHNGVKQAKEMAKKYNLHIPVGQSGARGHPSRLMGSYRTGGTPWTIIIDRQGVVRYNDFHIAAADAIRFIRFLKEQAPE